MSSQVSVNMHHVVTAGKTVFVASAGLFNALASGGVHPGVSAGQLLAGGGGIIFGLAILRAASEVGKLRQMVDNHEGRITRIEDNEDRSR